MPVLEEKKEDIEESTPKVGLAAKAKNMVPETLRDKKFWGGIGFTALATYIFSPLAMAGGAFVGGMMGAKAASKYDNPSTPKLNSMRKIFGAIGGAVIGAAIVFGCAFLGGVIGGPIGAIVGAGIGAALTHKVSSSVISKYAAPKTPQATIDHTKKDLVPAHGHVQEKAHQVKHGVAPEVPKHVKNQAMDAADKLHGASAVPGETGAHHVPSGKRHDTDERSH